MEREGGEEGKGKEEVAPLDEVIKYPHVTNEMTVVCIDCGGC